MTATTSFEQLLSRSIAAGYDPEVLDRSRVLVVGAGALGQNLLLCLALSGVRELLIADRDRFEAHNATRSPLFPGPRVLHDDPDPSKARICADTLARHATHPLARIRFADAWIEELGDAAFDGVDLVVSAVDTVRARLYLARKTMEFGLPFVEGGFSGTSLSFSAFPAPGDDLSAACWACRGLPEDVDVTVPCGLAARAAHAAGTIPALQHGAAVLAGLMGEAVVQLLHGNEQAPRRVQLDLRAIDGVNADLMAAADCAATHAVRRDDYLSELGPEASTRELLESAFDGTVQPSDILVLPRQYVRSAPCSTCREPARVEASLDRWRAAPKCRDCGGPWERSPAGTFAEAITLVAAEEQSLADRPLRELGVLPGDRVECLRDARALRIRLAGSATWAVADAA